MPLQFLRRRSSIKKEFNAEELQGLKTAFELLDRNQDGRVTTSEFKMMLVNLGINVKEDELEELIKTASHTGQKLIDENDFLSFVKQIQELVPTLKEENHQNDLQAAFNVFDMDGDGFITKEELKIALEMIGEHVTDEQLSQFFTEADTNKDGLINYEEFLKLLT